MKRGPIGTGWAMAAVLLCRASSAAELEGFRVWNTQGQAAAGVAWGETVLEVEKAPGGSLVRFAYIGVGDACGRIAIRSWETRINGVSPADLARPASLCRVTERSLQRIKARRRRMTVSIENDVTALVIQCGGPKVAVYIPSGLELTENDPGFGFLNSLSTLEGNVIAKAWAEWPDPHLYDAEAEERGRAFAALARKRGYGREGYAVQRFLDKYDGPIGRPAQPVWKIAVPDGVKPVSLTEPKAEPFDPFTRPNRYPVQLRLTVDRASGKVLASGPSNPDEWVAPAILHGSLGWAFDPAAIPVNGIVTVTARFDAACQDATK